ncbi:Hsp20/alpha crystallin family protein [Bacillus massilinigeriensis]|uniref:Hsp20/alpha crystallin family protein n=1 Tax=Bacillus mediterraneensis TaxID=1805474 RepID=UPI0008F8CDE8|nr:Hsp20/alpha crystallin family protein [Bacillus mediterraneensis]
MFPWSMLPNNKDMQKLFGNMKSGDVEKYIQDLFGKMFNENMEGVMNPNEWMKAVQPLQQNSRGDTQHKGASVFETHDYVYIRLNLEHENSLKDMKIFHTSNKAIIENLPQIGEKLSITLPSLVKKKGASAVHKDGVLEIRIPKAVDMQFSEVDVKNDR